MFQNPLLIHLHIPKTAGVTLRRIEDRQYPANAILTLQTPETEHWPELHALPIDQEQTVSLIRGHFAYGIHTLLQRPAQYFTLLRDPVERIISLYHYGLEGKSKWIHKQINENNMTLSDFAASGKIQTSNHQTRLISGYSGPLDGALERAKQNLDAHFAVVGTADRFDETLLLLKRIFGWKSVYYHRRNVAWNRPSRKEMPDSLVRLIESHNELDTELYRYVSRRLEVELNRKTTVQADVIRFRKINRWYGIPGTIMDRIRRVLPESVKRLVRRLPGFGRFRAGK